MEAVLLNRMIYDQDYRGLWEVYFCFEHVNTIGERGYEKELVGSNNLIDIGMDDEGCLYKVTYLEELPDGYLDVLEIDSKLYRINTLYFTECAIDLAHLKLYFIE